MLLIGIGLWDYFSLKMLDQLPKSELEHQLIPSIVGAIILVLSPLFEQTRPKWLYALLLFFLVVIALFLTSFALSKVYADNGYLLRHMSGLFFILLLLFLNIRGLKQGEQQAK